MLSYQLPFSQSRISRGKESIRFRIRNQSGFQNVTSHFIGSPAGTKERRSYELCEQKVQGHAVSGAVFGEEASVVLYNAVNETNYTNEEDLEINTLENVIYLKMKNDISFLFGFSLNLYEHQSSVNPNMPLRDLFYVADLLQKIVKDKNLYSSSPVGIPHPRFVMFL